MKSSAPRQHNVNDVDGDKTEWNCQHTFQQDMLSLHAYVHDGHVRRHIKGIAGARGVACTCMADR